MTEVVNTPAQTAEQRQIIDEIFRRQQQHQYAAARTTARERIAKLRRLHDAMLRHQEATRAALWADFRKPPHEVDISETICVNSEIRHAIRRLSSWMAPRPVGVRLPLLGLRQPFTTNPREYA